MRTFAIQLMALATVSACGKPTPAPAPATVPPTAQEPAAHEEPKVDEAKPEEPKPEEPKTEEAAKVIAPAVPGQIASDSGFRPDKNGFKFENYGNENNPTNLTAESLERLFGDAVCASKTDGKCTLTPPAEEWMEANNKGMGGGHCEGFAVLSALTATGKVDPASIGGTPFELSLDGNTKLQEEIAYWFVTQFTAPGERKDLTPSQVISALAESFKAQPVTESYTLGVYKYEYKDGHAVTPYAIREPSPGKAELLVYDNNYPGVERVVEVDLEKNTWKYVAAINPSVEESPYEGNAESFTLTIASNSTRLGKQACTFCGDVGGGGEAAAGKGSLAGAKPRCSVILNGDADLLITDAGGKHLGFVDGHLVNEIAGADFQAGRSNDALRMDDPEPVYELPMQALTITLDGGKVEKETSSELTILGPGVTLGVEDVVVDPGQKDTIVIDEHFATITYTTTTNETPTLIIGVSTPGADYEFHIKAGGDGDGHEVTLELDLEKGYLWVGVKGKQGPAAVSIEVDRIADDGTTTFTHEGEELPDGALIGLAFGAWKGEGTPMSVAVDKGGDGSIDETVTADDAPAAKPE